eukprot:scaffold7214_cov410-Prasinococcus_capsulatus_cf.AAC.6
MVGNKTTLSVVDGKLKIELKSTFKSGANELVLGTWSSPLVMRVYHHIGRWQEQQCVAPDWWGAPASIAAQTHPNLWMVRMRCMDRINIQRSKMVTNYMFISIAPRTVPPLTPTTK